MQNWHTGYNNQKTIPEKAILNIYHDLHSTPKSGIFGLCDVPRANLKCLINPIDKLFFFGYWKSGFCLSQPCTTHKNPWDYNQGNKGSEVVVFED